MSAEGRNRQASVSVGGQGGRNGPPGIGRPKKGRGCTIQVPWKSQNELEGEQETLRWVERKERALGICLVRSYGERSWDLQESQGRNHRYLS